MKTLQSIAISLLVTTLFITNGLSQDSLGIIREQTECRRWGTVYDFLEDEDGTYIATETGLHGSRANEDDVSIATYHPCRIYDMEQYLVMICCEKTWEDTLSYELVIVDKEHLGVEQSRTNLTRLGLRPFNEVDAGEDNPRALREAVIIDNRFYFIAHLNWRDRQQEVKVISVIDLSNPEQPEILESISLPDGAMGPRDLKTDNGRLYAFVNGSGVWAYNLDDPDNPQHIDVETWAWDVQNNTLAVQQFRGDRTIRLYNIEDPSEPELIGDYETNLALEWLNFSGDLLFGMSMSQVFRFDITNLEDIRLTGESGEIQWIYRPKVFDDKIYALLYGDETDMGLVVIDGNPNQQMPVAQSYITPARFIGLSLQDQYLVSYEYGNGNWDELRLNVEQLTRMFRFGQRDGLIPAGAIPSIERYGNIVINDTLAYYDYHPDERIEILDIRQPENIQMIGSLEAEEVVAHRLYSHFLVTGDFGFYDLSEPLEPEFVNRFEPGFNYDGEIWHNDYLYLHQAGSDWHIYRITDELEAAPVAEFGDANKDITISDNFLCQLTREFHWPNRCETHVSVFDITDPTDIRQVSTLDVEGFGRWGEGSGRFIPLMTWAIEDDRMLSSLNLLDLTDPENPEISGYYKCADRMEHAATKDNYVYVGANTGLIEFDCSIAMGLNAAPRWVTYPDSIEVNEIDTIEFRVFAIDPDNDNLDLTMLAENLPESARFTEIGDGWGEFIWITDRNSAGEYAPVFVASDGQLADSISVPIRILSFDNHRPDWTQFPDEIAVNEGAEIRFEVQAVDADGDSLMLTYSPLGTPDSAIFTDNGGGHGTFVWRTTIGSAGQYRPRFLATDGDLTASISVPISVTHINRPPDPPVVHLLSPLNGSYLLNEALIPFVWSSVVDPDGDRIYYLLSLYGAHDTLCYSTATDTSRRLRLQDILFLMGDDRGAITWNVQASDRIDTVYSDSTFTLLPPLGLEDDLRFPQVFSLSAFPNPFNSNVTIRFSTGSAARPTRLAIYDVTGRLVTDLSPRLPQLIVANKAKVVWDASSVEAGVYFVRLEAGAEVKTQKIVLMR